MNTESLEQVYRERNARGRLRRRRATVGLEVVEAAQAKGADILMFPTMAEAASPESEVERSQIRSLLEHAISDLPEPFRLVLIMRDIEECSIEETAAVLGRKPETVRTRLFRARKKMRRLLNARLSSAMSDLFPFLGAKCAATTEAVTSAVDLSISRRVNFRPFMNFLQSGSVAGFVAGPS